MKKTINSPSRLLIASLCAAVLSVIVRIVLTLTHLDVQYGVYIPDSILPKAYHIVLFAISAVLIAAAVYSAPKRGEDYICPESNLTVFTSCAAAFLLVADLLVTLYNIVTSEASPATFDIFEICFCIPAIIYFLILAKDAKKRSAAIAFLSFFPIAWCAVCLIRIYFDTTALNTSPNKIIGEIALLAAMLYFLNESRFKLGIVSHRFYLAAATVAPILLMTSAIPNLVLADRLSISVSDHYLRYAIDAVFALFIWARLAVYAKNDSEK